MKALIELVGGVFLVVTPAGLSQSSVPVWVGRLGWTLVHSIWQLAVIAIAAAFITRCMKNRSASARYLVSVSAMCLMVAIPCATWAIVSTSSRLNDGDSDSAIAVVSDELSNTTSVEFDVQPRPTELHQMATMKKVEPSTEEELKEWAVSQEMIAATPGEPVPVSQPAAFDLPSSVQAAATRIEPHLPVLVGLWLFGVLVCSIRLILGLRVQWQLRRTGLLPVAESIQAAATSVARRIGLNRVVRVAQSTLVKVPVVVGYLRPIILLPTRVLTGLTSAQLEAVLAHELAHVRRHDWLVNAFQVIVETVLFYHPAIWWLSKRVRHERELCCDDIVLSLNVDKAVYARTLLTLEELRQQTVAPALAATGGDLARRVRRLSPTPSADSQFSTAAVLGLLTMAVSFTLLATSFAATQQEPPGEVVAVETTQDKPKPEIIPVEVEEAKPEKVDRSLRRRSIQVADESGQPIEGAEVRFQFEHQQGHINALLTERTDAKGIVAVEAPAKSEKVHVTITAEGFGEFSDYQQATGNSAIRLKRGRMIHVRAVDEAGGVLSKSVPLLEQIRIYGREFKPQDDGTFKSPAVDMKRHLMRVVTAQKSGPMLFSDLVDVSKAKPDDDGILQLTLKPGTKLTGRLDDSVPRPITEGYAKLMVVEGPEHRLNTSNNRFRKGAWVWEDSAPIQPDGTFTFESVPSGGIAQIHVVVDGYMSVNPPLEELAAIIKSHGGGDDDTLAGLKKYVSSRAMWPHLIPVVQPTVDVTVNCRATASCDFKILDPTGNPVEDATVSFSPNGIFINGKLFIPGSSGFQKASLVDSLFRSVPAFAHLNGGADESPHSKALKNENQWGQRSFLRAKSDADGKVAIRNLPGGTRESFRVRANGFVLPHSPLYPGFNDRREGYIDLIAGETVEATIYLEREQPVVDREILVVDEKGTPRQGVTVALTEMRVGPKNWQMWSTQRFGTVQTAKTDQNGRIVLSVPSQVGNIAVDRLRLAVNYRSDENPAPQPVLRTPRNERLWIHGGLVDVPLKADGGLVALIQNPEPSRSHRGVVYGNLKDLLSGTDNGQLLKTMIKHPGLAILRHLLSETKTPTPEPIELLDSGRFGRKPKGVRVSVISSGDDQFALVSAKVRPVNGARANETVMSRLPDCVFVFNSQGQHVATLGGEIGTTGSGSPDDVDILSLGPTEDWFVRVTRFQENGPFEFQTTFYRIGNPVVESLRYFHYANSNPWSNGPEKITRYGRLTFQFPENQGPSLSLKVGVNPEGVSLNGNIYWDGDRNRFSGASALSVDKRPLFKVDTEWSQEFRTLAPKANQIILSGGAREHDHWYAWLTLVPAGFEAIASVSIPQADGSVKSIQHSLKTGRHMIQFQAKPSEDGMSAELQLGSGKGQKYQKVTLAFGLKERPATHPPIVNILNPDESVQLVKRPLKTGTKPLTLSVKLQAVSNAATEKKEK